jgi:acyl phosphate:glycerol-3-phosphate acyltransferase
VETLILVALAYLCGSVPVGFLLASLAGIDIRRRGSGNIGATNVARVVGWREGVLTLLGDVLKGFLPVLLSRYFGFEPWAIFWVGLASFLGHLYPVFLKFKGGKGVATALGILLAVAPAAMVILASIFVLVAIISRAVSLASLIAAVLTPLVLWLLRYPLPFVGLSFVLALLIVVRHRENIQRLLAGDEPKFKINSQ